MSFNDLIVNFKTSNPVIFSLVAVVCVIVVAGLLQVLISLAIKSLSQKYKSPFFPEITQRFRVPILLLSIIFGMSFVTPLVQFPYVIQDAIQHALSIAGIIAITWIVISFIAIFRNLILLKYDLKAADNFKARKVYTQIKVITRIINTFVLILSLAAIFMTFDKIKELGYSLLASAGISAAILGLAARQSFGSMFAGFLVALTQPIRIDDVVIVEKEWGVIEEINLNYVVMRIWDKRRLIIPINYFLEKPFENWSRQSTDLLGTVFLYVDYTIPIDKLRAELTHILSGHPLWDKQVGIIQVTEAKADVLELRVLVSASSAPRLFDLRCEVREKLVNYIQRHFPTCLPRCRIDLPQQDRIDTLPVKEEETVHE